MPRIKKPKLPQPEPVPTDAATRQASKFKLQNQATAPAFQLRKRGGSLRSGRTGL
jgi:hypothetical protein